VKDYQKPVELNESPYWYLIKRHAAACAEFSNVIQFHA
jgi:hypothetical protein